MNNKVTNLWDFCETLHSNLMADYNKVSSIYNNARKYTKYIANLMKKLEVVNDNQLSKYFPEYFTIDHTWWETNKPEKRNKSVNLYDWKLTMAVEHENDVMDWTYEVEKLDSIKANLKIVIGYLPNKIRENEKEIIAKQCKYLKHADGREMFALILMNCDLEEDSADPFEMKCYILHKGGPEKIEFEKTQKIISFKIVDK